MKISPHPLGTLIETDVLVIGSGASGCGAALGAREQGLDVVLLDKGKLESSGCIGGGNDHYMEIDPLMPGEDFSAFLEDCPGFFADLGTMSEDPVYNVPHHNSRYCMNEAALKYGVQFYYDLVRQRLG